MPLVRTALRTLAAGAVALAALTATSDRAADAAVLAADAPAPLAAGTYAIDVSHSELTFRIRHLVSRVNGAFRDWKGTITVDDPARWETARIDVAIQATSIDTRHERRDADLRTANFFDAVNHPVITFRSTRIERTGDQARIHGELTMRGVTRPVVLEGQFLGTTRNAQGKTRVGFEAETTIDRTDYGITWNRAVEGGGLTLGDDVTIAMTIAAVEQ